MPQLRVAIFTENFLPKLDGVTRTLAMLLDHLRGEGHDALVFGPDGAPGSYAGYQVLGAKGITLPFYPELQALIPPIEFGERLQAFRPDVVHVVDPMLLGAAGILWARRMGVPVVASYHTNLAAYCAYYGLGALQGPTWAYRRWLHNQCEVTLCPSTSTMSEVERHGFERVSLWARGVDAELFTPEKRSLTWRQRIAPGAAKIVLYVGRLAEEKNIATLVDAFLAVNDPAAHLVLVGDGPARAPLQRTLPGQRVTFTGYLTGEALAEAYASSDIFCFPSLTETFGQVVQEAMASGLPVLALDSEGVRDIIAHGQTGLLARDGAAFTGHLRELLAGTDPRVSLGAQARAYALTRTWAGVMSELVSRYHVVAGQASPVAA
jgi:glycosyltransferase involved in cell wall biosynthesis